MAINCVENYKFRFDASELLDHYNIQDYKMSPWVQLKEQKIHLTFQKTGFGERLLLICPICQQRYMTLYKSKNYINSYYKNLYICRKCLGWNYISQQKRSKIKYQYAIDKIYEKYKLESYKNFYIWANGIDNYNSLHDIEKIKIREWTYSYYKPFKPKFLHSTTFEKVIEKIKRLQKKWIICFEKEYSFLFGYKVNI